MSSLKLNRYQTCLYLLIIVFGLQNHLFSSYNFNLSFYEQIVIVFFGLSVLTVLGSVVLLIVQSVRIFNAKKFEKTEVIYLILHVILYYIVIWVSLYLSTQTRL